MNRLLSLLFFTVLTWTCTAQGVVAFEEPPIDAMMERYVELNELNPEIKGYRIQLLATTDRQKVEQEKQRFQNLYPGIKVDWVHSKPYYKLRAGAFRTRMETYHMLFVIKEYYPGAYPATEKLQPEELLR